MKRDLLIIFLLAAFIFCPIHLYAWSGYNFDSDNYIEIPDKESVRPGKDIEIYDYSDESAHKVHIISVTQVDAKTIIEVFDYNTRDYRTFEMDDDEIKTQEAAFLNLFIKGDRRAIEHR